MCAFPKVSLFSGSNGISTDPEKVKAVKEWPVPTSIRDVIAFVGLARRFIADFASIAKPLHAMTGKGKKFCWTDEAAESFQKLKEALISSPILVMPTDSDELVLDTDGAIGCVLSQRQDGQEKVIAYASRCLDRRETNYCVTRKDCWLLFILSATSSNISWDVDL